MIIEIPSSKQIPRNSHNDYRNKPKTLIQQSNKNQSSSPKSQIVPLKMGKPLPNAIYLVLFLDVVAGALREIDAILCTQDLSTIITTLLHFTLSHTEMDFPRLGIFIYLAMPYITKYTIDHLLIPPLFLSHRRKPMTPVPLMDILVHHPPCLY